MREDAKLDYLELPATDLTAHKAFYAQAFGWTSRTTVRPMRRSAKGWTAASRLTP